MRNILLVAALLLRALVSGFAQCSYDVVSSEGYTVHIEGEAVSLVKPATCGSGYVFKVVISYDITFVGGTPSSGSMYTLDGTIECDQGSIFFGLPNGGGSGTVNTSNSWRPVSDCGTSTPSSIGCTEITYHIKGPGIPEQYVTCTALPVEFIFINAKPRQDGIVVSWATALENNNDYYDIQKSYDVINFHNIGQVEGAGNSLSLINYEFVDPDHSSEIAYYRVKQVDYDGQHDYSRVVAVQKGDGEYVIEIYPTLVDDYIYIETDQGNFNVIIYSISGCVVGEYYNSSVIDVNGVNPGMYLVIYSDGKNSLTKKVIIN